LKFGRKHLWKVVYKVSSKQNDRQASSFKYYKPYDLMMHVLTYEVAHCKTETLYLRNNLHLNRGGHDHMVVGFTTTFAISAYHHWCCEFESWSGEGVQYCDKVWVTCNRSISSTNKTDGHDITEILLKVALNTIKQTITNIPKEMIMWPIPLSPL
jgi:hypothetical protein